MGFYKPLTNLINSTTTTERPFLFNNSEPTSLDALIYGHLSLHLFPTVPEPILKIMILEHHPQLAHYLHYCHSYFERRNNIVVRSMENAGWRGLVHGWGEERGKRLQDLAGIGGVTGVILLYAFWNWIKQ